MKDPADNVTADLFGSTIPKLRDRWQETIEADGGHCPICDKWGKVYKMKLSQALALSLKWIAEHGDSEGWVDVQTFGPRWMLRAKTYPLLVHWGMVESKSQRSGIWRATMKGRAFLGGADVAPSAVYIYDNRLWALDSETTTFRGCFGVHFDFDELMSSSFKWADVEKLERRHANAQA